MVHNKLVNYAQKQIFHDLVGDRHVCDAVLKYMIFQWETT